MKQKEKFQTAFLKGCCLLLVLAQPVYGLTIDEYILRAQQVNPLLKSYQLSAQSAESKKMASELDLSPVLTAGYVSSSDKSRPNLLGTLREFNMTSLGLAKKFSTGTSVKLEAQSGHFENVGVTIPGFDLYNTGSVGLSLQQSLWKDFFGSATRLKISRQSKGAELEKLSQDLQYRASLFDVETTFLDYALALEDFKLKKENLVRAEKIEKWTANRVTNGISDRSDLMNAKALTALRSVQLLNAQEELTAQEKKLRDQIKLSEAEPTPEIKAQLNEARPYIKNLLNAKKVQKIEAVLAQQEASLKNDVALETLDSLRPDLTVFGTYTTTSYERDYQDSLAQATSSKYPKSTVGVNFTWVFETDAKSSLREASLKEAQASQLKAEKKLIDSNTAWLELTRKYSVLQKSVSTLEQVAQFQRERAKAEQDKLSKGRTVTSLVVTAETDAAEAEINLLKTKSQLRKLEASSLFFTAGQE